MTQIPPSFIEDLKQQIADQYREIVRYRKLKNDAMDGTKRAEHQQEIDLRKTNIDEIEAEFLEVIHQKVPQASKDEILSAIEEVRTSVTQQIDQLGDRLSTVLINSINEKEIEENPAERQQAEALMQTILARLDQLAPEKKREIGENLNGEISTGAKLKMVIKLGIFQYEQDLLAFTAKEPVKNWKDLWKALVSKKPGA